MANYTGGSYGTPIPEANLVVAADIIRLGQITPAQFDMVDASGLSDLVDSYLPAIKKEVYLKVGGVGFNPLDGEYLIQMANNAIMYLCLNQMFLGLGSTWATTHDEPMPTEFRSVSGELLKVAKVWEDKYDKQISQILLNELSL